MTTYATMTVGGSRGVEVEAANDEAATRIAQEAGYEVLDVIEYGDELVLVVADED